MIDLRKQQTTPKELTIKEVSQTLIKLSSNLDNDEDVQAVEFAIYLMNKHLNGGLLYDEETKLKISNLINNLKTNQP
jgi:hypothetical protein